MPEKRWTHPDRLDRVASAGDAGVPAHPAVPAEVARVLARVLTTGRLRRIPRKPAHRDIVLAAICTGMRRRYPYAELELNAHLQARLGAMSADVDHVTCRRMMVDVGFVKRDRAGMRYFLNQEKLESTLTADSMTSMTELLRQVLGEMHQ